MNNSYFTLPNTESPYYTYTYTYPGYLINPYPDKKTIKKTTTTLEKYNKNGKLMSKEITIIEEEIYDIPNWTSTVSPVASTVTTGTVFETNGSISSKNPECWSYTAQNMKILS